MAGRQTGSEGRIALIGLAIFVVVAILLIQTYSVEQKPSQPAYSTYSSAPAGIRAAYELLELRGNDVSRHLLSEHEYPAGSCIVIADESALNPFKMVVNTLDVKALDLHLRDGGSLVIFSDNSMALFSELEDLIARNSTDGIAAERSPAALAQRAGDGEKGGSASWRGSMDGAILELSEERPPLLRDVQRLELADSWDTPISGMDSLLDVEYNIGNQAYSQFIGYASVAGGSIVVVNRPELITNSWIDRADNHRLVLAVIEGTAAGRPILFDEHIHGFNAERMTAGSLLTSTTGGRLTLLAVLCIILLFLGQAIMPARIHPAKTPARRQAAEMIMGQASLYKRAGFLGGTLRHLVDGIKHELMRSNDFGHLPTDSELLDWAARIMPSGWKMDAALADYLGSGLAPRSQQALLRASLSCDAMRMRIWQRPLG